MDNSNRTLRFNRSAKDAGLIGPLQFSEPHPTLGTICGTVLGAIVGAIVVGAWFWFVLGM